MWVKGLNATCKQYQFFTWAREITLKKSPILQTHQHFQALATSILAWPVHPEGNTVQAPKCFSLNFMPYSLKTEGDSKGTLVTCAPANLRDRLGFRGHGGFNLWKHWGKISKWTKTNESFLRRHEDKFSNNKALFPNGASHPFSSFSLCSNLCFQKHSWIFMVFSTFPYFLREHLQY